MQSFVSRAYAEMFIEAPEYAVICIAAGFVLTVLSIILWSRTAGTIEKKTPTGISGLLFLLAGVGFFGFALVNLYVPCLFLAIAVGWHIWIMRSNPGKGFFLNTSKPYEQKEALEVYFHELEVKNQMDRNVSPIQIKTDLESNLAAYGLCSIELKVIEKALTEYHRRKEKYLQQAQREAVYFCIRENLARGKTLDELSAKEIKEEIESTPGFYEISSVGIRLIYAEMEVYRRNQSDSQTGTEGLYQPETLSHSPLEN